MSPKRDVERVHSPTRDKAQRVIAVEPPRLVALVALLIGVWREPGRPQPALVIQSFRDRRRIRPATRLAGGRPNVHLLQPANPPVAHEFACLQELAFRALLGAKLEDALVL